MGESPESGHGAAPRRSRALPEETKRESSQRMGRLVLWLALAVLLPAPAILQPLDQAVLEEHEQMKELLTRMFVDNHREGRDLEEDMDEEEQGEARDLDNEEEEQTNLVDVESENEEAVEAVSSTDPQEIARFNNYMDAIYRRMNAALRAKLMDPMVLNMNAKVAKKDKKDKKMRGTGWERSRRPRRRTRRPRSWRGRRRRRRGRTKRTRRTRKIRRRGRRSSPQRN